MWKVRAHNGQFLVLETTAHQHRSLESDLKIINISPATRNKARKHILFAILDLSDFEIFEEFKFGKKCELKPVWAYKKKWKLCAGWLAQVYEYSKIRNGKEEDQLLLVFCFIPVTAFRIFFFTTHAHMHKKNFLSFNKTLKNISSPEVQFYRLTSRL